MRIACIYWQMVGQIGGIATRINRLRQAARRQGDTFDILLSGPKIRSKPGLFSERRWVQNKDTCCWTCGEAPHHPANVEQTVRWLEKNYDALLLGYICPNKTKKYPDPLFLPIYDCSLPKVAYISDGYWETYQDWGNLCLPHLEAVVSPQKTYLDLIPNKLKKKILPFPFVPPVFPPVPKSRHPLIVWPNQWKAIKGIRPFLSCIPQLPKNVRVEMYSCAVDYYQMRTKEPYLSAIGTDHFKGFNGTGRAEYFGNVDLPIIAQALQRAWYTCNLQGWSTKKEAYKRGSYNNTEVEALYFGACPILHSSTKSTPIPHDVYLQVDTAEEIPRLVKTSGRFALDLQRRKRAKGFVMDVHNGRKVYLQLRRLF